MLQNEILIYPEVNQFKNAARHARMWGLILSGSVDHAKVNENASEWKNEKCSNHSMTWTHSRTASSSKANSIWQR